MAKSTNHKGWTVVLAGTGINLALGVLYTWSIFKGAIGESIKKGGEGAFQWSLASINDPYAVCCLMFAFSMILAGKCQDRVGPRFTAMIGGLLVGAGFFVLSMTTNYWMWVLGFGVLVGMGLGFGYSSATPPALKWFPPAKTGLIAGIVVSGFGLAPVYIAPLATYLMKTSGLQWTMLFFAVAFALVVGLLSLLLSNPPAGYLFGGAPAKAQAAKTAPAAKAKDFTPSQMMKTGTFYLLWTVFFIGAGAGLMVIGSIAGMAKQSMGELAFLAVVILAVGNASGRIIAGSLSDRIGRTLTLSLMLGFQAVLMFMAIPVVTAEHSSALLIVLIATFIGFNYGTNLALFPAITKDYWGLKNFGANYGMLMTAWGLGGFVLGRASEMMQAATGGFALSFGVAGILLAVATVIMMLNDLFQGMVRAKVKEELARRDEEAAQAAVLQPALEQAA
ncbi:MAG: OFA family MFS transporter [Candidatus Contendobacter sp.]|nr:OFA family MFS transporter [Candidatus Contendobacter sp.]MDG4556268.1 OFA family MFS transporter [Candidatus Contendobacter sp.]